MPGLTSLGISYPCSGEAISLAGIADHANTTQAALSAARGLAQQVERPPAAFLRRSLSSQTLTAAAAALISFDMEVYDTADMWSAGAPTVVSIPSAGTYLVEAVIRASAFPGSPASLQASILLNTVSVAARKSDGGTPTSIANNTYVSTLLPGLVVGDQITLSGLYQGTLTLGVQPQLSIVKLANV